MSVLYPGTAICTDSVTWTDAKGNWYERTEWHLPDYRNPPPIFNPFWGILGLTQTVRMKYPTFGHSNTER